MKIRVKLYGMLSEYLPAGAVRNEADLEVPAEATPKRALMRLGLSEEQCDRVVVNGTTLPPAERGRHPLEDGDHIAVWPPGDGS